MYLSIIFNLIPTTDMVAIQVICIVRPTMMYVYYTSSNYKSMQLEHWLFTVGYSLAFGAVLAKMWRVLHIFHNPKPNKTVRQLATKMFLLSATNISLV